MNYILEINAFERRMKRQPLPIAAQLLWYKLMAFANRQHWPEWFTVDNERLTEILGASSDKTVRTARQQLIDSGLITYEKGVKGKPGRYKLTAIAFDEFPDTVAKMENYPVYDKPGIEEYIEDDYTNNYGYTEAIGSEIKSVAQELFRLFRPGDQVTRRDEIEVFSKIIDRKGSGPEGTVLSVSEEKKALLVYAFEQASLAGAVNWRYINGIYEKLRMRGIQSVDKAVDYDLDREYRRTGR